MKYFCLSCGKPTSYTLNLPKFCSQCGAQIEGLEFKRQDNIINQNSERKSPQQSSDNSNRVIPVDKMDMASNDTRSLKEKFKIKPIQQTRAASTNSPLYDNDEYIEEDDENDEYIDVSRFKNIKPKFTIQSFGSSTHSLEDLVTQGYITNSKPQPIEYQEQNVQISQNDIFEEFRREAGATRQK
jgi:hypothetical protein